MYNSYVDDHQIDINNQLHQAAYKGNKAQMQKALTAGAQINSKEHPRYVKRKYPSGEFGYSALEIIVIYNRRFKERTIPLVDFLIENDANVNELICAGGDLDGKTIISLVMPFPKRTLGEYTKENDLQVQVIEHLIEKGLTLSYGQCTELLKYIHFQKPHAPRIKQIILSEMNKLINNDSTKKHNNSIEDVAQKELFNEFKKAYFHKYNSEFFKNPWSKMKRMLERNEINTMKEVEEYAKNNTSTRSTKTINWLYRGCR